MPGKRIKDLTPLSGAGSANNDDVVIFDADADATKRISRSQLAEGMQGDVQVFSNKTINLGSNTLTGTTAQFNTALSDNNFATQAGSETLTNKTIDSANNTLTVNYKEARVETSDASRTHLFTTVAALLADTGTYTTYAAGQIVEAGGFRYEVAASGASDHHVATAGGVKLYGVSGALPILDGGTVSHSDGVNTLVGSARYFIGNNTSSTDDSALLIGRGLTGSYVSGAHAVRDESTMSLSGSGLLAYASFDAIPVMSGSVAYNHLHGFQARPDYSGSNTIDAVAGHTSQITHSGVGVITEAYGLRVDPTLVTSGGFVGTHYALFVGDLEASGAVGAGYAIYSGATNISSYHGGLFQFGTPPNISAAGFTTFGAVLSHDASGNLITNPNLTIVNGVLDMKNATTSRVVGSASFKLQLDAAGVVEAQKPLQMPVYTVATLPSPASAYTYCRAFVSDANATTFNSVVAGGGANRVPVFCDGTNWRIG